MANNTGTSVAANQTFNTGVVTLAVGVLNPTNSPQTVWDAGVGYNNASMTTLVTGAPASCTVLLEGTYDGNTWRTIATSTSTTGDTQWALGTVDFTNLRARCTGVSGGTSPTINVFATVYQSAPNFTSGGATPSNLSATGMATAGVSLNAATTTSPSGATIDMGAARNAVAFEVVPAGTITGGAVQMQVSPDGVTWFSPATASFQNYSGATAANPYTLVTGTNALFVVSNVAFRYARVNVSTTVTGTGASVTASVLGY